MDDETVAAAPDTDFTDLGIARSAERKYLGMLSSLVADGRYDARALAVARTHAETAALWVEKALSLEEVK